MEHIFKSSLGDLRDPKYGKVALVVTRNMFSRGMGSSNLAVDELSQGGGRGRGG